MGSVRPSGEGFHIRRKKRLIQEKGWCERSSKKETSEARPCQHLHLLPASRADRCTPLLFWLPVVCVQAALVMDTHPLVKSLKMCPFPNRPQRRKVLAPSRLNGHIQSQQETQTGPVQLLWGPEAFWVLRVYEKGQSRPVNHKMDRGGAGTHVTSLRLLRQE